MLLTSQNRNITGDFRGSGLFFRDTCYLNIYKLPRTPRADPMQAWSAAALPFMLMELLGLSSDGFARRLVMRRSLLPDGRDTLAWHGIWAGGGMAALRCARSGDTVATKMLAAIGLEVVLE